MFEDVKKRIEEEIAGDLKFYALEVIDFSINYRNRTVAIVLLLDHHEGGISLDECAHFNKKIGDLIEREALLGAEYTVEVASPGLDRPLKTSRDFARARGKRVKFHLKQMIEGKLEHDGVIQEVGHDNVVITIGGKTVIVPFGLIQKAVILI